MSAAKRVARSFRHGYFFRVKGSSRVSGTAVPEAQTGEILPMKIPDEREGSMNRCDWLNCLAVGHFDGVDTTLLNALGRKNILINEGRFIYLCPQHFRSGVAHFNPDEIRK